MTHASTYFIICLDAQLRHFAEQFRELFSKPQFKYLVTVLLGLMLAEGARTLVGLRWQKKTVSGREPPMVGG